MYETMRYWETAHTIAGQPPVGLVELTDSAGQPMRADTHLGQRVGGQTDIRKVTAANLIDEAVTWVSGSAWLRRW